MARANGQIGHGEVKDLVSISEMTARRVFGLLVAGFMSIVCAAPALAAPDVPGDGPHATASLIAETKGVAPGQKLTVALRLVIQPGWHTYWVNPGDSGLPTTIDWKLPAGFSAGDIAWPAPERIPFGPLVSYGYSGEVLLPVTVMAPAALDPGSTVALAGHANWLACSDVCVPEESDVALALPVSAGPAQPNPEWAGKFAAARAEIPVENPFPTIATIDKDTIQLKIAAGDASKLTGVAFYPLDDGVIDNDVAPVATAGRDGITITLKRPTQNPKPADRLNGVLAFHDSSLGDSDPASRRAIAISGPVTAGVIAPAGTPAARVAGLGLVEALLLAILGGMVLNLMPCVLPVLSIKALSLIRHAQSAPREVRLQGLAYAAGVLASFALVAGTLIALRTAGAEIGWGFQLQSPIFLTIMIYVLFAVGLSLSGVFTFGDSVAGIGSGLAAREGYGGSFFTGALATLVATPCTAPFMAAAIGFAITQPWYVSFAVFEAIGVGLALPYVLLAFSPAARRFLPKPGAWMNSFKQLLAFPVYGTAVWLAFVLASESGSIGITAALAGLVLIGFAAWLYEAVRLGEGRGRLAGLAVSAIAVAGALALLELPGQTGYEASGPEAGGGAHSAGSGWEPFSAARLASLRAAGKPVFVDFTADWCITCKVNERVALGDPAVKQAFAGAGVVTLRGDWTRRDGEITRVLEANGRGGVPLYLFYAKGADPVILPQILTADTVLQGLRGG
jgi:thiol:disulfide interchange protein DsbD